MTVAINTYVASVIRTASSYLIGWLISLPIAGAVLSEFGVDTVTARDTLVGLLTFTLGTAWYIVVRALEHRWPQLGLLLGVPAKPSYTDTTGSHAVIAAVPAQSVAAALAPLPLPETPPAPVDPPAVTGTPTVLTEQGV